MTKNKSFSKISIADQAAALGLSAYEAAVYLAALELGQGNIQELSRKSGVKRTSIYNFIDELLHRQLLTEIKKGKRKHYIAVSPYHLVDQQRSKVASIERLLPELLAVQNAAHNKPRVMFFEGVEGIKEIYMMTLRDKKTIYAWEDLDRTFAIMPAQFANWYPAERASKNIPARCIDRDTPLARKWTAENDKRLARESRFVASEEFGTEINIFGNKVAFFSFRKDAPFGVVIEDFGIASALRVAWQELWDRLPARTEA